MSAVELFGVATSVSLLAGWRLYLCAFATGLAMRFGWLALPDQLKMLDVLANPWVIGIAGTAALCEFFADKLPWFDSVWDTIHTLVRPVGGALLAVAIVDPADPGWQVATLLLGGGGALVTHGAKAGVRAVANTSPEPFSNWALSATEDVATGGLLALTLASPAAAMAIAALLLIGTILVLVMLRRLWRKVKPT